MRLSTFLMVFFVGLTTTFSPGRINAQVTLQSSAPFPFGAAINVALLKNNANYRSVVTREFNSVTPENVMKMDAIHPAENTYDWTDSDTLINYAEQNGKRVHGHVLIWHNQLPSWVTNFTGDTAAWDTLMRRHIKTIVAHYSGRIGSWDVVNEAFNDDGTLRNSVWMQHLGADYIAKAFRYAREADPTAVLFYNDYGHDYSTAKLNAIYALLVDLRSSGNIDGAGLQMHLDKNTSFANLAKAIDLMSQTGLKIHFSELDVSLNSQSDQAATYNSTIGQLQTHMYKFVTRYYKTKVPADQQFGITTWDVSDADTWIRPVFGRPDWPLPFDDNYGKKQAYQGIIDGLTGSFDFNALTAQNLAGTYTDLESNGTAVTTNFSGGVMGTNDENSSVQNIGFNFEFDGTSYTNFVLNTNGFIKFGVNVPSLPSIFFPTSSGRTGSTITSNDIDLLYPYNHGLTGSGTSEYRVYTSGAAGSRVCTIQFKNVLDKIAPAQYAALNFQVKLYEAGNTVDFVYGSWAPGGNGASSLTAAAGIKGIWDSSVNVQKSVGSAWALSNFINGDYTGFDPRFNTSNSLLPDAGRTFRFRTNQAVLPLSLLQLSTAQEGATIRIEWTTANELNTSNFEVQRSVDGRSFIIIGAITAKGNSGLLGNNYNFTDVNLTGLPATLFYRLNQIDKDGKSTFSKIVTVKMGAAVPLVVKVINPVRETIDVLIQDATAGKVYVYVTSLNGAILLKKDMLVPAGSTLVSLRTKHTLAQGLYVLKVIKGNEERVIKVAKQ